MWDAPKLTGQRSGESGILTGRFGTSKQLKECGPVEPTGSTQTKVKRNGIDIETFLEVFLLEIRINS